MTETIIFYFDGLLADIAWRPLAGARWIWWISAAHLLAAVLCLIAGRRDRTIFRSDRDSKLPIFWFVLAAFMFLLFLNKLFDLQSLLTIWLRRTARDENWYSHRRTFQWIFVCASAAFSLICLVGGVLVLRTRWKQRGLAYAASVLLMTLIVVRTASYTQIDEILYHLPVVGNRVNAGLELAGAVLVSLGSLLSLRTTHVRRSV